MVHRAPHAPLLSARRVLERLLDAAKRESAQSGGRRAWVALDMDGTLFDNRPRTLAILHSFAMTHRAALPQLLTAVQKLTLDDLHYTPSQAIDALELPQKDLGERFIHFWRDRFFTNSFQPLDHVEPGAAEFAHRLVDAGLGVVYLTGRDRPGMMHGVLQSLDAHGFPLMSPQTQVVLKPDFGHDDIAFKREALVELAKNGPLVGLIDNEPGIVNMALETLPDMLCVRILRPHAPNPPPLDARAVQIPSFRLDVEFDDLGAPIAQNAV
jgi:hypothetical protein